MGEDRILLYRAVPGPSSLGPILSRFARGGEGSVTCLRDGLLPILRELLGDDSGCEVVSFGTLVKRSLDAAGEETLPPATPAQVAAAVGQAAKRLDSDSPFRFATRFPGLREAIVRVLDELQEWGIGAAELREISGRVGESLRPKLSDLSTIVGETRRLLNSIGRDMQTNQLRQCCDAVPDPDGREMRLLAFLGSEASPARLDWLKWAARNGVQVTAVVDRHATDGPLFGQTQAIEEYLHAEGRDIGTGNRLLNNLFSETNPGGVPVGVRISSSADPLAECEWALRECQSLGGGSASAIYVRNLETYAPLIESASERLEIPVSVHRRVGLLENAFARMTLELLEALAGEDVRRLRSILRSSYLGLAAARRSELASLLAEAHSLRSGQWEALASSLKSREEEFGWLLRVLDWRRELSDVSASMAEWRLRLAELVDGLPWHEALATPSGYDPKRDERAFSVMQSALATEAAVERAAGSPELSLRGFVFRCKGIWASADVSVPSREGIRVASDAASLGLAGHVMVLGMLEGVFPRRRTEDAILTDSERREISALNPQSMPLPTSEELATAERDEFYRVCAACQDSITFSYPLADDERDNIPAFYLEFVKQAAGADSLTFADFPRDRLSPDLSECLTVADTRLREAIDGPREEPAPARLRTETVAAKLRRARGEELTPGELRDALQCPFLYQARHLELRPSRRLARWTLLRRIPQFGSLAAAATEERAREALEAALELQLEKMLAETSEWEIQVLRAGAQRLIRDWVRREFLSRKVWSKDVGSVEENVSFGSEGLRSEMPGGDRLKGTVAAKSTLDSKVKVLTTYARKGEMRTDLSDAEKLYYGLHFLAAHEPGVDTAVEVEGMDGHRSLLLLARPASSHLQSRPLEGLSVIDLSTSNDAAMSKRTFFAEVKGLIRKAADRIEAGKIEPIAGEQCDWCEFGELCRSSRLFSDDDSPFGEDMDVDEE